MRSLIAFLCFTLILSFFSSSSPSSSPVLFVEAISAKNTSCVFQLQFEAADDAASAAWPKSPNSLTTLYNTLLKNTYPTLNATISKYFSDVIFNVTLLPGQTSPDPYVGCKNMLKRLNIGTPETVKVQYGITQAWIGFRPVDIPSYMRHITPQPESLYIGLGATGAGLIVVQIIYGLYHWYINRGTLESVGND